uniref:Uncharacterized protein n=1 Tax=Rhizophagus irregularis (strain DAOM 181602 / DAOM 197198 / MUCL 43194) TaxID=747089 RepID=U9THG4_RHIID
MGICSKSRTSSASDSTNLVSKNDFNLLKNTLQKIIHGFIEIFLNLHPNSKLSGKSKPRNNFETIDSKIITFQHVELISRWIGKLDITDDLPPLTKFLEDTPRLNRNTSDITENYVLSRVVDENRAIWYHQSCDPTFGNSDLVLYLLIDNHQK